MSLHINLARISDYYLGKIPNEIISPQVIKDSIAIFLLLSNKIYFSDKQGFLTRQKDSKKDFYIQLFF